MATSAFDPVMSASPSASDIAAVAPHPEYRLHVAIAAFLHLNADPAVWTYFHCPNGERRDKRTAGRLRAMGVKAGVSDLVIDHRGRITYVEIKSARGSLSPAQRRWRDAAIARGAGFYVVKSIEEMEAVLTELGIPLRARLAA